MYGELYDSDIIRNERADFVEFVAPGLSKDNELVDLGCGTCRKVIRLAQYVKRIAAIDRNEAMLKQAAISLKNANITNVGLLMCDNVNTPFSSHSFDVCTTALSTWSATEAHRILKPNGLFFIETLSPDDKCEIKRAFGSDELGARGYLCNQSEDERLHYILTSLAPFFDVLDVRISESRTTLSADGFVKLLELTPTVRNFSAAKDGDTVKRLVRDGEVSFSERRIMISARAKNIEGAK